MININKHKILKRVLSAIFAVSVSTSSLAYDFSTSYITEVSADDTIHSGTLDYTGAMGSDYPQLVNGVLTLEDFSFTSSADVAIKVPAGTTILLKGTNKITSTKGVAIQSVATSSNSSTKLTFKDDDNGKSSLILNSKNEAINTKNQALSMVDTDITIVGGSGIYMDNDTSNAYTFDMDNSKLDVTAEDDFGIKLNNIIYKSVWSESIVDITSRSYALSLDGSEKDGFVDSMQFNNCTINMESTNDSAIYLYDVNDFHVYECDEFNITAGKHYGIEALGSSINIDSSTADIEGATIGIYSIESGNETSNANGDRLIQFKACEVNLYGSDSAFKTDLKYGTSDKEIIFSSVDPYVGTNYSTDATIKASGNYTQIYNGNSVGKDVKIFDNNSSNSDSSSDSNSSNDLVFNIKFEHDFDNGDTSKDFFKSTDSTAKLNSTDFYSPVQDGYNFKGWYLGNDGSGSKVSNGYTFTSNTTVYACWEAVTPAVNASITFDANGGSIISSNSTLSTTTLTTDANGKISLLPNATREDYTFLGWHNSSSDSYVTTSTIYSGDTYLVAKWEKTNYITFDFGHSEQDNIVRAVGSSGTVIGGFPTPNNRTGIVFQGWYTSEDVKVVDGATFSSTQTLTAKWSTAYNITFDPVLSLLEPPTQTTNADGKLDTLPKMLCPGYGFDGWYTATEGGSQITTTSVFTEDTTVYARWVSDEYTVTFKPDYTGGVDFTIATTNYEIKTLPSPGTRSGYQFDGWYTKQNGAGTKLTNGYEVEEDMIVYALWSDSDQLYNDSYNGSGFEEETGVVTITLDGDHSSYDDLDALKTNTYGRITKYPGILVANGLAFDGWYTGKDGTGEKVYEDTKFLNDTTIYANWIEGEVTVTINQDYSGSFEIPYATTNNRLSTLPTPKVRPGYTFDGWYWTSNSTGSTDATIRNMSINLGDIIKATTGSDIDSAVTTSTVFTNDAVIYASWTAIEGGTIIVSFDSNGGTPGYYIDQTGVDGRLASLPTPTREGYTFLGWYDGTLQISTSYIFRFDTEVYAKWQLDSEYEAEQNGNPGYGGSVTYQRDIPTLDRLYVEKFQNLVVGDYIIGLGTVSPNRPDLGTFVGWYHGADLSRPLDYFELQSILVTEELFQTGIYPKFEKNIVSTGGSSGSGSGSSSSGGYVGTDVPVTSTVTLGKLF